MRVLLSGATGFIGWAFAERLRSRGDVVVPVTRREPAFGEVGIDLERGRLDSSQLPGGTLEGIDASVHLAGVPIVSRWTAKRQEAIRSSRIAVGDLIARSIAVLERRPAVHVTGSAIGIYGDRGEEVLDESSETGSGFLADLCRAWEAAASPATAAGIRTVVVRTGIVLGPGGGILKPQTALFKLGLGGRLGSGHQWVSWISLEDEVNVLLRTLDDHGLSGPVNAVSPGAVRNSGLTAALAHAVGRPARVSVPAPAIELVLGKGPAREMVLASQRVEPRRLTEAGFTFAHPTIDDALASATR
jgi:uncharacterized protein (TIGR01777 family)